MALRSDDLRQGELPSPAARYQHIRARSLNLCAGLEPEDCVVQSMPSASPLKWHLAHTSWFFEQFILLGHAPGYEVFNPHFDYLFNSYYYTKGQMYPRPARGLLTRPTVRTVCDYRGHVDAAILHLLDGIAGGDIEGLVTLGLHHEEQHQELMLTDIKHAFSLNPLEPGIHDGGMATAGGDSPALSFVEFSGGRHRIGAEGDGFCFDNETPRHDVLLRPYALANRPVTNAEYREFIADGGYEDSALWLSDGWAWIQEHGVGRPLYWSEDLESGFTLAGRRPLVAEAPVSHVSFYEADAYARWAGARLPTEAEWEVAAAPITTGGNFAEDGAWHPQPAGDAQPDDLAQIFGDVWEWTASPYSPYPGFRPLGGSLGEYNGKFMCNQMVCRGGSCVTPAGHIRPTYRNFFYPHERWQFFGIRLARDL